MPPEHLRRFGILGKIAAIRSESWSMKYRIAGKKPPKEAFLPHQ
jgi:hypothetical protein